jgi:hypothetical protein
MFKERFATDMLVPAAVGRLQICGRARAFVHLVAAAVVAPPALTVASAAAFSLLYKT